MTTLTAKPLTAKPLTARPLTAYGLGESTEGANPLVWHALAANSSGVITDQIKGAGTPTWAHTSSLLLPDYQGVYRTIGSGEAPIVGARWVDGVPYATDELGDPLTDWFALCCPALTNTVPYSNDLTGWTKVGTPTTALDAAGLTGVSNTATTLGDDSAAGNEFVYKSVAVTGNSEPKSAKFYIKKDADVSRFVGLYIGDVNTRWADYHLNTSTGAITLAATSGVPPSAHSAEANDAGVWWEVIGTVIDSAITTWTPGVGAADGSVFGTRSAAVIGTCIVGNVELYINKSADDVRRSPAIITAASSAGISQTDCLFDSGNISDTSGALYFEAITQKAVPILDSFIEVNGVNIQLNDGSNTVTRPWVKNTEYQIGIIWSASESLMALCVNGTWTNDAAYDGTLLSGGLDAFGTPGGVGLIRNIKGYRASGLEAGRTLVDADMP